MVRNPVNRLLSIFNYRKMYWFAAADYVVRKELEFFYREPTRYSLLLHCVSSAQANPRQSVLMIRNLAAQMPLADPVYKRATDIVRRRSGLPLILDSIYMPFLVNWKRMFQSSAFLILVSEWYFKDPTAVTEQVVVPFVLSDEVATCLKPRVRCPSHAAANARRYSALSHLSNETLTELKNFLRPFNRALLDWLRVIDNEDGHVVVMPKMNGSEDILWW
jgi:hypothetical protein